MMTHQPPVRGTPPLGSRPPRAVLPGHESHAVGDSSEARADTGASRGVEEERLRALRVLIVDDERLARRRLARLATRGGGVVVIGECESGEEAISSIRELDPDVILLDVQMPGTDGFGVVAALAPAGDMGALPPRPAVVFVTAHDEHAIRAFDVAAVDYVLKPVDGTRLTKAIERARARLFPVPPAAAPTPEPLRVSRGAERLLLSPDEVGWVESWGNYARVHAHGKRFLLRETMSALTDRLAPLGFARIHRTAIVNLRRIAAVAPHPTGEYYVRLESGETLRVGRVYRDAIAPWLGRG
jgi:two-component system LytT family response regulator